MLVRKISKKKLVLMLILVIIVAVITVLFTQKEVLLTLQANSNNYEETRSQTASSNDTSNWNLTKVNIVYDKTGIAVPVPIGYTASSVESEMYVNGLDEVHTGTETELTFTSSGDYPWTQNEADGVWVSGNKGVKSTTSTLTSNEFTVGENGGRLTVNWTVSCYYGTNQYLYAIITNTETGETIRSSNINNTKYGTTYSSLVYTTYEEDLEEGTYTVSINYYRSSSTSTSGLDSGYVKSANIVSYDETGTTSVTEHKYGGFVIYEGEEAVTEENKDEAQKTRNQWVWVPVSSENVSRIYSENSTTGAKTGKCYSFSVSGRNVQSGSREPAILTNYDNEYYFSRYGLQGMTRDKFYQEMQIEFDETIESIKKYGGFYIGRYETGNISQKTPVVQKMNTNIASQSWYAMYSKMEYLGANTNVKANMIWGCLWDETLQWLVDSGTLKQDELVVSTSWGNYYDSTLEYTTTSGTTSTTSIGSGTKIPTGSSEYTNANNIYDMAGNVYDWTLEANGSGKRFCRGGGYYDDGSVSPASYRYYFYPGYSYDGSVGFRAYFYVK